MYEQYIVFFEYYKTSACWLIGKVKKVDTFK